MKAFTKFFNNIKSKFTSNNNNIIIHNKFILYFIFFISLADLFYLSVEQDIFSVVIFILIGFLTSYFSKNMLIILFIALTLTNVLKYGSAITNEGFEQDGVAEDEADKKTDKESNKESNKESDKKPDKKTDKESEKKTNKESLDNKKDETKTTGKKEEMVISKNKLESGNLDDIHKEEEALKKKKDKKEDKTEDKTEEEKEKKVNDRTEETIKMFSKIVNALSS